MSDVAQAKRANKYKAKGCWLDLRTGAPAGARAPGAKFFASQAEGTRFTQLLALEAAGLITRLRLQRTFDLSHNGVHICKYRADFDYQVVCPERGAIQYSVVEDVKGMWLDTYDMKKKLVRALHGIEIFEIPAKDVIKWHNKIPPPPKG